jgi:hypothetical protein
VPAERKRYAAGEGRGHTSSQHMPCGVLARPIDKDDYTPLSPWMVLSSTKSTIKYVDAAHYKVCFIVDTPWSFWLAWRRRCHMTCTPYQGGRTSWSSRSGMTATDAWPPWRSRPTRRPGVLGCRTSCRARRVHTWRSRVHGDREPDSCGFRTS